jgi:hypothetical protein
MKNQKASYAELMTIALVGELTHQAHAGTWFLLVRDLFKHLFRTLPDITRYYRIMRNLERIWADLALGLETDAVTIPETTGNAISDVPIATSRTSDVETIETEKRNEIC